MKKSPITVEEFNNQVAFMKDMSGTKIVVAELGVLFINKSQVRIL
jgi:hypothetical protein